MKRSDSQLDQSYFTRVFFYIPISDQKYSTEKRAEDRTETSLALSTQEKSDKQKEADAEKAVAEDCSSGNQADKTGPDDSSSDGADLPKGRPMSPATLALMCDEQDTMFMAAASPDGLLGHGRNTTSQMPYGQGMTEVYAEQERIVLTKFRDCLTRLITVGEIKGKIIYPLIPEFDVISNSIVDL